METTLALAYEFGTVNYNNRIYEKKNFAKVFKKSLKKYKADYPGIPILLREPPLPGEEFTTKDIAGFVKSFDNKTNLFSANIISDEIMKLFLTGTQLRVGFNAIGTLEGEDFKNVLLDSIETASLLTPDNKVVEISPS